ncbi:MAG: OmpA family protein [Alphaproteobacteria bacterium]|uniref:OmpA family protein n=1 Tax=Candidatus Nitrobium versatile TaxID=2884831 RepID=A0A953JEI8_9BACT|nr:OmpA family protein [Candidatus Nitrobium versatile]
MNRKFNYLVFALIVSSLLVGCAGMERSARKAKYDYYHTELVQADKALMAAQAAGKDKECPAEYNALKAEVDRAYDVYHSCRTKEAIGIANDAQAKIKALCPPKPAPAPEPKPAPAPAPEPAPAPAPAPEPKPAPAPAPEPKRVVETLVIHINFDVDKAAIRKADENELQKAIAFVEKYPDAAFRIEGHTDSTGSDAYNQKLSERRAESVKRYLVAKGGFDKARFSTVGYGETKPIATNKTKEGRFENRRVEISALSE